MQTIDQIPGETDEIQELTDEELNALAMSAPEVAIAPIRERFPWRSLIWSLVVCTVLALGAFVLLAGVFIPAC